MKDGREMGACAPSLKDLDHVELQLLLGQISLNKGDDRHAFEMFALAARSGRAKALNMLGRAYERGWGVKRNPTQAIKYFDYAAQKGEGWANFNLADLYLSGDGVACDPKQAFAHYVLAAQRGVNKALNMLGILHEQGMVTGKKDFDAACLYFTAGAEGGDCWAAFNRGRLAAEKKEYNDASFWLRRSLSLEFPGSCYAIKDYLENTPSKILHSILCEVNAYLAQKHQEVQISP
ncbi:sel1 repeat family protein [Aristophania vespae]|uniref:Sel1 repeat family protein n=1 Tax=Aristophania vespae TaxID=2697033 RepID=A0A6P1NGC3_9PROT|nr:tetratricopeptide repeat protein [Aristophania vespae]QHI95957.1 sel1 repeat family protein [Aristophania vespae]